MGGSKGRRGRPVATREATGGEREGHGRGRSKGRCGRPVATGEATRGEEERGVGVFRVLEGNEGPHMLTKCFSLSANGREVQPVSSDPTPLTGQYT